MERLYYEVPSLKRKEQALEYTKEHIKYNSDINGSGSLHRYLDNYEGWLEKLESDYKAPVTEERVPARTYFLIRESDDKIVGMINIRLALTESLKKLGGNIGYGIRPTERKKGYNKINLYLGLQVCKEYNIDVAMLDAKLSNPASWKTMEALGGVRVKEYEEKEHYNCTVVDYNINVKEALEKYKNIYEPYIAKEKHRTR